MQPAAKNPAAVALGSLGGRVRSKAQTDARRKNGRNGGLTSAQAKKAWAKRRANTNKKPAPKH